MNVTLNLASVEQIFDELQRRQVPFAVLSDGNYGVNGTPGDLCSLAWHCLEMSLEVAMESMMNEAPVVDHLREAIAKTKKALAFIEALKQMRPR